MPEHHRIPYNACLLNTNAALGTPAHKPLKPIHTYWAVAREYVLRMKRKERTYPRYIRRTVILIVRNRAMIHLIAQAVSLAVLYK